MTRTEQIDSIGRKVGETLGIPYAYRVAQGSMHISFDELDAAKKILGDDAMLEVVNAVNFDVTDKGLIWEV